MPLSIDADCAFAYWMSKAARVEAYRKTLHDDLIDRIDAINLPDWTCAPDGCIHVLATTKRGFINRKGVYCRVAKTPLPGNSFSISDEGLSIVSPECCFLRLASDLSFAETVKAGMLLCARFSFDGERGLIGCREPITTSNALRSYVGRVKNVNGVKRARRAARFLIDSAASPPEIDACLLFCLPIMEGGYGCPPPELNGHIKLNPDVARGLGYEDCYCDLLWRNAKCAVEYTSEQFHTGYRKQAKDEIRRAALEAMGYRVFLLTKPQLYNSAAFEGVARAVLHVLKKRMPARTPKFQGAQYALRKTLLYEPSWIIKHAFRMQDSWACSDVM